MKSIHYFIAPVIAAALSMTSATAQQNPKTLLTGSAKISVPVKGKQEREDKVYRRILILSADQQNMIWKDQPKNVNQFRTRLSSVNSLLYETPEDLQEAIDLYEGRKYLEAHKKFIEVEARYKKFLGLDDNPSAIAGYYGLLCLLKQENYDQLHEAERKYTYAKKLTRPHMQKQVDLYSEMWDLIRVKSWDALNNYCTGLEEEKFPASQRAQIDYCHALALENLSSAAEDENERLELGLSALNYYSRAMTADSTKSEVITRNSFRNSLRVYSLDKEVEQAETLWGQDGEKLNSAARARLIEAGALVLLYEKLNIGGGVALPESYLKYKRFKQEEDSRKGVEAK